MADQITNLNSRTQIKINGSVFVPHGEYEYKFDKLFFSAIKEEEWLNAIAKKGYMLVGRKFTGYIFKPDKNASKYYYSVCLLPAPDVSDYSEMYIEKKSGHKTQPVCTFSNKAYFMVPLNEDSEGIVNDAIGKRKHLRRAFAFHAGLLMFFLSLLCYNFAHWVYFDAAGIFADRTLEISKFTIIDLTSVLGKYPTTPYISILIVLVVLCIPFTVYYFDQFMYSRSFLNKVKEVWQKK